MYWFCYIWYEFTKGHKHGYLQLIWSSYLVYTLKQRRRRKKILTTSEKIWGGENSPKKPQWEGKKENELMLHVCWIPCEKTRGERPQKSSRPPMKSSNGMPFEGISIIHWLCSILNCGWCLWERRNPLKNKVNQMRSPDLEFRPKNRSRWIKKSLNHQNLKLYKAKFFHLMILSNFM